MKLKGRIKNKSKKTVWVVENTSTKGKFAKAHKLGPNRKTPEGIDADAVKAITGTISGYTGWWKINDLVWATIEGEGGLLKIDAFPSMGSRKVKENEFGTITYDHSLGWGTAI